MSCSYRKSTELERWIRLNSGAAPLQETSTRKSLFDLQTFLFELNILRGWAFTILLKSSFLNPKSSIIETFKFNINNNKYLDKYNYVCIQCDVSASRVSASSLTSFSSQTSFSWEKRTFICSSQLFRARIIQQYLLSWKEKHDKHRQTKHCIKWLGFKIWLKKNTKQEPK